MAKSGKRIRQIYNKFDRFADHEIADAVKIVLEAKKTSRTLFFLLTLADLAL